MFFLHLGSPKAKYLRRFFASGSKNHGIYNVFWPAQAFSACCKKIFSMPKAQEHSKLQRWLFASTQKKGAKIRQKVPKMDLKKASRYFFVFFPTSDPKKRENNSRVKDFGGGRQGRPRVAKANTARYHKTRRSIAGFKGCRPLLPTAGQDEAGVAGRGRVARPDATRGLEAQGDSENEKTTA